MMQRDGHGNSPRRSARVRRRNYAKRRRYNATPKRISSKSEHMPNTNTPERRPLEALTDDQVRVAFDAAFGNAPAGRRTDSLANTTTLKDVFEGATRAMGATMHIAPGFDTGPVIRQPAVASGVIDLTRALTPAGASDGVYHVNAVPAGVTNDVDPLAVMRAHSRVVSFGGARLIVASEKPRPVFGSESGMNAPGFYRDVSKVRTVLPAALASITDGQDAALSPLPITDADFHWSDAPNFAFRAQITRRQRRDAGGDQLAEDFMIAIAMGLGALADSRFVQVVLAAMPAAFSIGALAARHAKLDEARALVGTAGAGASFRGDGVFVAGPGIPAELTASSAATVAGLFNRAAIAIRPELSVHVKRQDMQDTQELTVFGNLKAVIPNASGDFWTVA
ncbi:hypothetical protein V4890_12895 [Ralstonia solanacearum species complex bacterium KE056]|uniref:hypothetical protein n=1 Tax=Ralstonia solanacearum species complex bacterium KE056 TaxID=3119585 RepID=UPI002FC2AB06